MRKHYAAGTSLVIAILLAHTASICAAYIEDREAAVKLKRKGETQAALEAFREMAQGEVTDVQKSDAREQAVL